MWVVLLIILALVIALFVAIGRAKGATYVPRALKAGGAPAIKLNNLHKMTEREFERAPDREFSYAPKYDLELTRALIERAPELETMLAGAPVCVTADSIPHRMSLEPIDSVLVPVQEVSGVCQLLAAVQFLNRTVTGSHHGGFLALIGPIYFPLESLRALFPRLRLLLIDTADTIDTKNIKKLPAGEIKNSVDKVIVTTMEPELRDLNAAAMFTDSVATEQAPFTNILQRGGSGKINLVPVFSIAVDLRAWVIGPQLRAETFTEHMMYYALIIRPYGWYGGRPADHILMDHIIAEYCNINSLGASPKLVKVFNRLLLPVKTRTRGLSRAEIYSSLPSIATNKLAENADYSEVHKLYLPLLCRFKTMSEHIETLIGEHDGYYIKRTSAFSLLGLNNFIDAIYYRFHGAKIGRLAAEFINQLISGPDPDISIDADSAQIGDLNFLIPKCARVKPENILKYIMPFELRNSAIMIVNTDPILENAIKMIKQDYGITDCYMLSVNPLVDMNSAEFTKKLFIQSTGIPTGLNSNTLVVFLTHGLPINMKQSIMAKLASHGCRIIGIAFVNSGKSKDVGKWTDIIQDAPYLVNCKTVSTEEGIILHALSKKYFSTQ